MTGKAEVKTVQYDWRSPEDFKSYDVHPSHVSGTRQANRTFLLAPYGLPRRPRGSQRAYSPPVEDPALLRRRQVYRNKLFSFHVGSNHFNSYREITPETFLNSAELQSKARTWIRRELRVFTFLQPGANNETRMSSSNPEFLLTYIVSILKMVDLKASNGHAENLLAELLGRGNSKLFLHELNAWLRSPFDKVDEWDNEVQYEEALDGCA